MLYFRDLAVAQVTTWQVKDGPSCPFAQLFCLETTQPQWIPNAIHGQLVVLAQAVSRYFEILVLRWKNSPLNGVFGAYMLL